MVNTDYLTEAEIVDGGRGEWRNINFFFIHVWIVSLVMGTYDTFII